jgi:hypothetical protein
MGVIGNWRPSEFLVSSGSKRGVEIGCQVADLTA